MREPIEMPFVLRTWVRLGNHVLDVGPDTPSEGAILAERRAHSNYRVFLPWAVQERLNRSICHLDCGLGWAEGSRSSVIFTRWRQCAHMGRHIGATWWTRLNHPFAAAMQCYVKLLWPLVIIVIIIINTTGITECWLWVVCIGRLALMSADWMLFRNEHNSWFSRPWHLCEIGYLPWKWHPSMEFVIFSEFQPI